ncbi:FkbM family methyltransferase [Streptomyces gamaensis]|uniref:FkbM family methyltransferase n=1 Tax=Streptomyces gamaensis TaxID=1763542 RepID=A0ABW0YSY6_9ACTN
MRARTAECLATVGRWWFRYGPGELGRPLSAARGLNAHLRDCPRRQVVRTWFGARFVVDTEDLIQRYLYLFGVWEPHLTRWLQRRLRPGDTFVDVGANVGYFSLLASQLVGEHGAVVAVEASPAFHRKLVEHARINGCCNIRAARVAVSDARRELTFVLASHRNLGANSIVPYDGSAESTFTAEARPLAEVLTPPEVVNARVLKIDVEGAEGSVVRGMVPLLDRLRDDAEITVEVSPERMWQLGDCADELLATMREHGFHVYRIANDYRPESYPGALHGPYRAPVRWRGPVDEECDLVFSRMDAETLP